MEKRNRQEVVRITWFGCMIKKKLLWENVNWNRTAIAFRPNQCKQRKEKKNIHKPLCIWRYGMLSWYRYYECVSIFSAQCITILWSTVRKGFSKSEQTSEQAIALKRIKNQLKENDNNGRATWIQKKKCVANKVVNNINSNIKLIHNAMINCCISLIKTNSIASAHCNLYTSRSLNKKENKRKQQSHRTKMRKTSEKERKKKRRRWWWSPNAFTWAFRFGQLFMRIQRNRCSHV